MGTGSAGQSVEDMERVIAAMRRVVERLQTENDSLKKQVNRPKSSSNAEMQNEIRRLKVGCKGGLGKCEIAVIPLILSQITVVPTAFFIKLRVFVSWVHMIFYPKGLFLYPIT